MLIYEVNVTLADSDANSYRKWLKGHVDEIVEIEGFSRAIILKQTNQEAKTVEWTVQYFVRSKSDLDRYLAEDAPRLRGEAEKLFGGKFKAQRRVLEIDETVTRAASP